jgi:hypothetical protein
VILRKTTEHSEPWRGTLLLIHAAFYSALLPKYLLSFLHWTPMRERP